MDSCYRIRKATRADAPAMAMHRGLMFLDMQLVSREQSHELIERAEPWFAEILVCGDYHGWIVEEAQQVVAGAGLHLGEIGPQPGCMKVGRSAHIANVYTMPEHRRRGIAKHLIEEMLTWSRSEGIDQITLSPSLEARSLYESLGFCTTDSMKQKIRP